MVNSLGSTQRETVTGDGQPAPTVSVVTAAYNASEFIRHPVASCLRQTLSDWELIIVDDASTDDTVERVRSLTLVDPRVRLIALSENGGPGVARNHGIAAARGRYVAILDADDTMTPERLNALVSLAEAQRADLVADNIMLQRPGSFAPIGPLFEPALLQKHRRLELNAYLRHNNAACFSPSFGYLQPIIRRQFLIDNRLAYPEGLRIGEDFFLSAMCLAKGGKFLILPECHYGYTVRARSLTRSDARVIGESLRMTNTRLSATLADLGLSAEAELFDDLIRSYEKLLSFREAGVALRAGDWTGALKHLCAVRDPGFVLLQMLWTVRRRIEAQFSQYSSAARRWALRNQPNLDPPLPLDSADVSIRARALTEN